MPVPPTHGHAVRLRDAARAARQGFTLIEVLLALAILALLLGLGAVNFGAFWQSRALEEGASRLETAIRMARAEAENHQCRYRLAFNETDGRVQVLWEAKPLEEPGKFSEAACTWGDYLIMQSVRVERCELTAPSIYQMADPMNPGSLAAPSTLAAITFEPNGASDSAVIELSATDPSDTRRAFVSVDGLTRTVTSRVMTTEEMKLEAEQSAQSSR